MPELRAPLPTVADGTPPPHRRVLSVMGIPVEVSSNAAEVLAVAGDAFGGGGAPAPPEGPPTVRIRIVVRPGDEGRDGPPRVEHRVLGGHRIRFRTPGSEALADPARRRADADVTTGWLAHPEHFRRTLLEGVILAVVTRLDRQPLHASAVARGEAGLLLCAPGGTGKSTLAWAAHRAGLRLLSEDTVYLQERPRPRVWGMPGPVHLPPESARWFPELAGVPPRRLPTGKRKLVTRSEPEAPPAWPWVPRVGVCLVRRGERPPGVAWIAAAEIRAALTERLDPGFDLFRETLAEPVSRLAAGGGWRLDLPPDPRAAVPWLVSLLDEVEGRRP